MKTNYARRTMKLNPVLPWQKQHKKDFFSTRKLYLILRKKLIKCYIWSVALYGAEVWTLRKSDQKYLEGFKMWCWRNYGEDHLNLSCENWSITQSQGEGGKVCPTYDTDGRLKKLVTFRSRKCFLITSLKER